MSKYYRLLEKGEKIEEGDVFPEGIKMRVTICAGSNPASEGFLYFRPIPAPDEWQEYAKVKPTREDFEPTEYLQWINADGEAAHFASIPRESKHWTHWRRVTPPELPKPKSVRVTIESGADARLFSGTYSEKLKIVVGDQCVWDSTENS